MNALWRLAAQMRTNLQGRCDVVHIARPKLPLFLLIGLMFSFVGGTARAEMEEWKSIGPYTGVIHAIAMDPLHPDIIYAGTDEAGVFKTTDGGVSWVTANDGLGVHNSIEVYALVIDQKDSGVILAGTGDGIFRSMNRGFTWAVVKRTLHGVRALAIDPSNGDVIYAGLSASFGDTNMLKRFLCKYASYLSGGDAESVERQSQFVSESQIIIVDSSKVRLWAGEHRHW